MWTGTWTSLPHPQVTDHERAVLCLYLQDSKKDDEVAVPVRAQEQERYYPTPPHPTGNWSWKSSRVPVSAGQQERWWGCWARACTGTWTLLPHPTPPVTDHERALQCLCLQDSKKDDEVAVPVCVHRNMNVITPPHPTPPVTDHERALQCLCLQDSKRKMMRLLCLTPCPSPMSPSGTLKVWFSGALSDPLFWCSKWSHGALSDPVL